MPAFFFQAEDGIRDLYVTGVQTCALPICTSARGRPARSRDLSSDLAGLPLADVRVRVAGPSRLQRAPGDDAARSEERRVGKECRSRDGTYHVKIKKEGAERAESNNGMYVA